MKDVVKLMVGAGALWLLIIYGGFTGHLSQAEQAAEAPAVSLAEPPAMAEAKSRPAAMPAEPARPEAPAAVARAEPSEPPAGVQKKAIAKRFVVYFDFDSAKVSEDGLKTIREALAFAKTVSAKRVGLAGFADRAGPDGYNMALSERRAGGVAAALRDLHIGVRDLDIKAFGEHRLAVQTADGMAEQRNRRVEIFVSA